MLATAVTAVATGAPVSAEHPVRPDISVVSSDPSRVTGGDALVEVLVPDHGTAQDVRIAAGDRDVTADFTEVAPGVLRGLVTGLPVGTTRLTAVLDRRGRGPVGSVTVVNHPIAGPVFSGAHQTPFYCETAAAGLGPSQGEDCFAPTQVVYRYLRTNGTFAPLADPADRPADLATVTVGGATVPFIVRLERGVINRGIYEIAAIHDGSAPSPLRGEATWNGKLVMTFGGGCNVGYHQGSATAGVFEAAVLSRGYAVASNSLLVNETNCNPVIAAETAAMTKERLIEVYGPVRHTIGLGGSGGAIMQHTITHGYPGILDGLLPIVSYADAVSNAGPADCALLVRYLSTPTGSTLTADQRQAIGGHQLFGVCNAWVATFADRIDATRGCPSIIPPATIYHPVTNPTGVRCSLGDHLIKQVGADPETGFARATFDNTGVQYGLGALQAGVIDVDEFLDLNANMGGFDADGVIQDARSVGDPIGIANLYRTGLLTSGLGGLASTPTIDLRAYTDFAELFPGFADIHTSFWSVAMHERLVRDGVDPTLHSRWIFQSNDGARIVEALDAMDAWLEAIAADTGRGTPAQKAARNRPEAAAPGCWPTAGGAKVTDLDACYAGRFTYTGDLRTVAGAPITSDVTCQRRPPRPADYGVTFTAEQWARLLEVFPDGVCDWSRRGIGQVRLAGTWQSYD
jgi:hypothetical protein